MLNLIPKDIINEIFDKLDICQYYNITLCCKKFKTYCDNNPYFIYLNKNRKFISCGCNHTMIIKNYKLYAHGYNYYYQLGLPHITKYNPIIPKPSIVPINKDIISVSCGQNHTIVITTEGTYSFGCNLYGQLGVSWSEHDYREHKINIQNVMSVSCGETHNLLLTKNGIYSFGNNVHGELGLGHNNTLFTPTNIPFFLQFFNPYLIPLMNNKVPIASISCGYSHSMVIINNNLYGFGNNTDWQLGFKNKNPHKPNYKTPQLITSMGNQHYIEVSCGFAHTMVLTLNGLYGFGRNSHGQLGISTITNYNIPEKVNLDHVISVKCGSTHTTALTSNGFYVFGDNYFGQLGTKTFHTSCIPQKIKFNDNITFSVNYMNCGDHHTIVYGKNRNKNEKYYVFGQNKFNQLGLGPYKNKKYNKPQLLNF